MEYKIPDNCLSMIDDNCPFYDQEYDFCIIYKKDIEYIGFENHGKKPEFCKAKKIIIEECE